MALRAVRLRNPLVGAIGAAIETAFRVWLQTESLDDVFDNGSCHAMAFEARKGVIDTQVIPRRPGFHPSLRVAPGRAAAPNKSPRATWSSIANKYRLVGKPPPNPVKLPSAPITR